MNKTLENRAQRDRHRANLLGFRAYSTELVRKNCTLKGLIYWATSGDRAIKRATLDGEDVRLIASEQENLFKVASDAVNVYWTALDGTLSMASVEGGADPVLISSGPQGPVSLVLDATSIYTANFNAGTVVVRPK